MRIEKVDGETVIHMDLYEKLVRYIAGRDASTAVMAFLLAGYGLQYVAVPFLLPFLRGSGWAMFPWWALLVAATACAGYWVSVDVGRFAMPDLVFLLLPKAYSAGDFYGVDWSLFEFLRMWIAVLAVQAMLLGVVRFLFDPVALLDPPED